MRSIPEPIAFLLTKAHRSTGVLLLRALPIWLLILAAIVMAVPLAAQDSNAPKPEPGHITGTVTDVNDDVFSGATVFLEGPALKSPARSHQTTTDPLNSTILSQGPYRQISAKGFADWNSPAVTLNPGQYVILSGQQAQYRRGRTTVSVNSPVIPPRRSLPSRSRSRSSSVFSAYSPISTSSMITIPRRSQRNSVQARAKVDRSVTILGVVCLPASTRRGTSPTTARVEGLRRTFGAASADGFADIMIGGAILPSLLHQDPRYYYQGTGTKKSRALHALSSPFIFRGDNGKFDSRTTRRWGGDLACGCPRTPTIRRRIAAPGWFSRMSFSAQASACSAVWCKSSSCTSSRPKPKIRTSRGGHGKAAQDAAQAIRMNSNRGSWPPKVGRSLPT